MLWDMNPPLNFGESLSNFSRLLNFHKRDGIHHLFGGQVDGDIKRAPCEEAVVTLPETNKSAPENGWLKILSRFLLGALNGLFCRVNFQFKGV